MCRHPTRLGWTPTSWRSFQKCRVSGPSWPHAGEGPSRPCATCRHPTWLGWMPTLRRSYRKCRASGPLRRHAGEGPSSMSPFQKLRKDSSPRPLRPQWPFTNLDDRVPHPVRLPAYEPWVKILNDAKDKFEVDGAAAVFSTWRAEGADALHIGDVEITDGMHARASRLALDAWMANVRAIQRLAALPGGLEFILKLKFLRKKAENDWVLEDKFDPVRVERKKDRVSSRLLGTQLLGY